MDIRDTLLTNGYAAIFSEEIDKDAPSKLDSTKAREMAQAKVADFIVVIMGSPGSIAEVSDFAGFIGDIGSKMLERVSKIPPERNPEAGEIEEGTIGGE